MIGKGPKKNKSGTGSKKDTSRSLAVSCLTRWDRKKCAIGPIIDTVIYHSGLGTKDRHLSVMLINGVLRQKQYLDAVLEQFSKHPLRKMKTLIKMTLRAGIYQILFLDRIPDSAAVNETVNVLQIERQPRWMINFANGVLRNIVRQKASLPRPETELNHPDWLVQRWQERFGRERTSEICRRNNREPVLTLRVNTDRIKPGDLADRFLEAGVEVKPGLFLPEALILKSFSGPVGELPGYAEGLFHVQDEAAQLVTLLCGPYKKEKYLDCCAGLGGKTSLLAQLLPEGAQLVAIEPNDHRVRLLTENLKRLCSRDISVYHGSLDSYCATSPGKFGGILVDAPCSGTGVIGRHPDIRWNRQKADLKAYRTTQLSLLKQASELVDPGGVLVYATCSMEPEENNMVIEAFLHEKKNFRKSDCRLFVPEKAAELIKTSGYISTDPADGLDGFFGARLVRVE